MMYVRSASKRAIADGAGATRAGAGLWRRGAARGTREDRSRCAVRAGAADDGRRASAAVPLPPAESA
jgi:hypothetical protein